MMKARTSLWASLAIAASIGLAGCGGSNDNEETVVEPSGPTPEEQIAAAQQEAADAKQEAADAQAKLDAAAQAEARKDARDLAGAMDEDLAIINSKRTLTSKFAAAGSDPLTMTTGRSPAVTIPALARDADDTVMYSGAGANGSSFTARVYSTKASETEPFADNLPGNPLSPSQPGRTSIGSYSGGVFTFSINAQGVDAATARVAYSGIEADDFPENAGEKDYGVSGRIFDGKLDGATGEYACEPITLAAGCQARLVDGVVTLSEGKWVFTPSGGASAETTISDSAYLYYGWWLHKNREGGIEDVGPVFFHNPATNDPLRVALETEWADLDGTATYKREKGAAGQYAVYDPAGSSEVGYFTADATLTVTFDEKDVGSTDPDDNYVSGTIDNFTTMSDGEATDAGEDWMVALGRSDDVTTNAFTGGDATWSIGDDKSAQKGSYTATLYTETASGNLTGPPDEIGGTFNASFGQHRMLGAFAATLSTADDPAAE